MHLKNVRGKFIMKRSDLFVNTKLFSSVENEFHNIVKRNKMLMNPH